MNRNQGVNQKKFIPITLMAPLLIAIISASGLATHGAAGFCLGDCSLSEPPVVDNHNFRVKCVAALNALGIYDENQINQCVKSAEATYNALKDLYDK